MPLEGISARKLVLEAARFNVITGYSGPDALELMRRFPKIDGGVVHSGIGEAAYKDLIDEAAKHNCFIVLLSPGGTAQHSEAEFHLPSHDPKELMDLLVSRITIPEEA